MKNDGILKATGNLSQRIGSAEVSGVRPGDGSVIARFETIHREAGWVFRAGPAEAERLVTSGRAEPARLTGQTLALAEVVLTAPDALGAVRAAMSARSPGGHPAFRAWHAERGGDGLWRPATMSGLGLARNAFSACFRSPDETAAFWAKHPEAVPLLMFDHAAGFVRAFVWRAGGLLEIPTEVYPIKG